MNTFADAIFEKFRAAIESWPIGMKEDVYCLWIGITGDSSGSDALGNELRFHHFMTLLHSRESKLQLSPDGSPLNKWRDNLQADNPMVQIPEPARQRNPDFEELQLQDEWLSLHSSSTHDPYWQPTVMACEIVIERMHRTGLIHQMFNRIVPILIIDDEGIIELEASLRCNPARSLNEYLQWRDAR